MENAPLKSENNSETDSEEDAEARPLFKLFKFESPKDDEPKNEAPALPALELVKPKQEDEDDDKEASLFVAAEAEEKPKTEIVKEAAQELPPDATLEEHVEAVAAETPEAPEAEAPTEEIGEAEKAVIEPELVAINRELEAEEPVDDEVERFRDLIVVEGKDSETAFQEVMAELDSEDEAEAEAETNEDLFQLGLEDEQAVPATETEGEESSGENLFGEDETMLQVDHDEEEIPALSFENDQEANPDNDDENVTTASAATGAAAGAVAGAAAAGGGGATASGGAFGGGSGMPPHGPGPGGFAAPGGPGGFGPGGGGPGFNAAPIAPVAATANRLSQQAEHRGAHPATLALFGGVIGYLVGRRRGRIKAENRLLPVQKKLEKQVDELQWQLQEKEEKIRKAAARTKREAPAQPTETPQEETRKIEVQHVQTAAKTEQATAAPPEQRQVAVERQKAPEAHQLHGSEKATEHIGQVLMAVETPVAPVGRHEKINQKLEQAKQEDLRKVAEKAPELNIEKRAETMTRAELLGISEKIIVDGSSLRQIYETHLIGERGLRRLVAEHLRGGDVKRVLKQEVVEREIDFERDPAMRDIANPGAASGGGTAAGGATLNTMIEKAAAQVGGNEETAYYKARANYQEQQHKQELKQQRIIDASIIGTITVLLIIIAVVFFSRGG